MRCHSSHSWKLRGGGGGGGVLGVYWEYFMVYTNNNTQNAAVAPRPSTTHPLVWAEQHKHTSVYNLPVPGLPP